MLNFERGKGFQKSEANPLLKTLLEGRKIRAVHFRSLSSRAEKSVLSSWRVKYINNSPMSRRGKELSKDLKNSIIKLYEESKSQRQIAKIIGKSPATVKKIIEKFQADRKYSKQAKNRTTDHFHVSR
ncbi:hypothetical protein TNCV_4128191 [Trichonephila clavipes]|uniref:Transposase IS30-like HTH domain-containing protein n=1 Tax=Trichonephila clavipes TaxID=2585209 RepID=A0A8X6VI16_TRICX|nr:hypothetical protein TNCV_4128191 [Trichonephila clavipes]